jgi:hypothetical protein
MQGVEPGRAFAEIHPRRFARIAFGDFLQFTTNLLVGDAQANVLTGGPGRNILIGGAGADTLNGGAGQNILIGGTTDDDICALDAVMTAWPLGDSTFASSVHSDGADGNVWESGTQNRVLQNLWIPRCYYRRIVCCIGFDHDCSISLIEIGNWATGFAQSDRI